MKIIVKNRKISPDHGYAVEDNINVDRLTVQFEDTDGIGWSELDKVIVFKSGVVEKKVVLDAETITVPWEVLQAEDRMYLTIIGTRTDPYKRVVTEKMFGGIRIRPAGNTGGDGTTEATPDVVTQILENSEFARKTAEDLTKSEEGRKTAEAIREKNEDERNSAENVRIRNETVRNNYENARILAENARNLSETERKNTFAGWEKSVSVMEQAEGERIQNEAERKKAEGERINAESDRQKSEESRVSAENSRVSAENSRNTAETARENAESERDTAEKARASNETGRITAESGRADAERMRADAENSRAAAETARNTAEENRQAAEQERENFFGSVEGQIIELKTDKADKTALSKTERSLNALWKLNEGISHQFETDETASYQKDIPTGAKIASIDKIGGKSFIWNQLVREYKSERAVVIGNSISSITSGISFGKMANHKYIVICDARTELDCSHIFQLLITDNNKETITGTGFTLTTNYQRIYRIHTAKYNSDSFVSSLRCLGGGDNSNTLYMKNHQVIDLTEIFGEGNEPSTIEEFESMFPNEYYPYNEGMLMSAPVNEIVNTGADGVETYTVSIPQAVLEIDGYGMGINDGVYNYVDFETKAFHKNVGVRAFVDGDAENADVLTDKTSTIYPLAEEEIIDISDILTDIEPFEVESGGTLTFKNTNGDGYRIPVPNSVEYVVSLKEVGTA